MMTQNQNSTTLFDHFLSGGANSGWNSPKQVIIGCEVISMDAEPQLLAMAGQFASTETGWYGLVLNVPGFLTHQWDHKPQTLETLIPQLIELKARAWLFLLESNTVVVFLRTLDKTKLVGFVQKLSAALVIDNTQPPKARLFEMATQQAQMIQFAQAEYDATMNKKNRKVELERVAKLKDLDFTILPNILDSRKVRARPVILVVEDDPSTAQVLEHLILANRTVEVHVCHNASDAAVAYRRLAPDLVLLDIGLPEIDGLTLLQRFRAADPEGNVVMLTANAYRSNLEKATQLGAKGFVAKPFTPAKLAEVINRFTK